MEQELFTSKYSPEFLMDAFDQLVKSTKCSICKAPSKTFYYNKTCEHILCQTCCTLGTCSVTRCPLCNVDLKSEWAHDAPFEKVSTFFEPSSKIRATRTPPVGSSPTKRYKSGMSPFLKTLGDVLELNVEVSQLIQFIENGANPNELDCEKHVPLYNALLHGDIPLVEFLLDHGALPNAYIDEKCSLLHHAIELAIEDGETPSDLRMELVRLLLIHGADIHLKDAHGRTCLEKSMSCKPLHALVSGKVKQVHHLYVLAPERPVVVYPVGLNSTQSSLLSKFCKLYKLKLSLAKSKFSSDITHLVVSSDSFNPVHSILMAILNGCYIVTFNWVQESLSNKTWSPPENYEVACEIGNSNRQKVPLISRKNAELLQPRLFSGGRFHVLTGSNQHITSAEKHNINQLILAGGGQIVMREPKSFDDLNDKEKNTVFIHAKPGSNLENCSVVVLYNVQPTVAYTMKEVKSLPISWLRDCITSFSIL